MVRQLLLHSKIYGCLHCHPFNILRWVVVLKLEGLSEPVVSFLLNICLHTEGSPLGGVTESIY